MIVHHRRGRGIKYRGNYRYVVRHGNGILDSFKPVISIVKNLLQNREAMGNLVATTKDVYSIGKNTKNIVDLIRKTKQPDIPVVIPKVSNNIEDIISKINRLRTGSGVRCGKGFAYV